MDQSFSPASLRKVWDRQTRKGRDLLALYPKVRRAYEEAREAREAARSIRAGTTPYLGPDPDEPERRASETRAAADHALQKQLGKTSERLINSMSSGTFKWGLETTFTLGGRQLYGLGSNPSVYFADKHLQQIIASLLPSRPPSRQAIVSSLARTLDNSMPKILARTDVQTFYESVDHAMLRDALSSTALSPTALALVTTLLTEMSGLTGAARGLPMGVGLSAKLAEFYITQADVAIRDAPNVLYYARYVDDIVVVYAELKPGHPNAADAVRVVTSAIESLGLKLNPAKQQVATLSPAGDLGPIEFLGYELEVRAGKLKARLTPARRQTIESRIENTFDIWDRSDPANHGRRSLLVDRLRLLAGNTRLSYNKRNAMVGIYFSNPHLTDDDLLRALDDFLQARASRSALPPELASSIAKVSFLNGFHEKRLLRFHPSRVKKLRGAWDA
jgi:hypothetical protein